MGSLKRSIAVKCSLQKAFDYVADWNNLKSFISNILDMKPISFVQYGPGAAFETTYKVKRAEIPTTLEIVDFVRDKRMFLKSTRGLKVKQGWEFKEASEGIMIEFSLEYELPPSLSRSESDRIAIEKEFDNSATKSLQLLKWILESSTMKDFED